MENLDNLGESELDLNETEVEVDLVPEEEIEITQVKTLDDYELELLN